MESGQRTGKLDFMILGAQKAGTTALAEFLDAHPEIGMSRPKEAHAFDNLERLGLSDANIDSYYEDFFRHAPDRPCRGEATPIYLYLPDAPANIARCYPQLKLIVLLRDPVERALSHYRMSVRDQAESLPFWAALLAEPFRLALDSEPLAQNSATRANSYRSRGLYSRQLRRYLEHFPPEQILVLATEDLRLRHAETLEAVQAYLGVARRAPPPPREVFSQAPLDAGRYWFTRRVLWLSYWFERRRLRALLAFLAEAQSVSSARQSSSP